MSGLAQELDQVVPRQLDLSCQVTADMIQHGDRCAVCRCPVALAVCAAAKERGLPLRQFDPVYVGVERATIRLVSPDAIQPTLEGSLPRDVRDFIRLFDAGWKSRCQPFAFQLRLERIP